MKFRTLAISLALAGALGFSALAASAQMSPSDSGSGAQLGLQQLNNSGEIGTVTLYPHGANTQVVIDLKGEPAGRSQPAHIHRGKDCDSIDPKPTYVLKDVVNGRSSTSVHAPIAKLLSGNYAVNVHLSAKQISHYVSCGALYK